MRTRRNIGIVLGVVLVGGGLVWALNRKQEPSYKGRRLGDWIRFQVAFEATAQEREESTLAVRAIGAKGLPCLLDWLYDEESPLARRTEEIMNSCLQAVHAPLHVSLDHEQRAMAAAMALYKLGKDVEPAIPALTRMLDDRSAPNTARRAADVLANINTPETTAPIMRLLTNGGHPHQWIAVLNLQTMGTNAALGIPLLVECLSKTNRFLAEAAAISLGELKMEPAGVVPALTKALQHPDAYTRARVARALGCFQAQARPALPALLNALNDTNPAVRKEVADALKRIEKRTPTNAPAPAP